ncbi:60S ribosomal protein L37-A [Entamoeba marina]
MTKGTSARGTRHNKSHINCKRCGKRSWNLQKQRCASCGYPDSKMRQYAWGYKALRRRTQGTGRMRYLKTAMKRTVNVHNFGKMKVAKKSN